MLEPLFNKLAGQKACNFIKKTPTQMFSCAYCEFFKNSVFIEHLRWLLLYLTDFWLLSPFYTPSKHNKIKGVIKGNIGLGVGKFIKENVSN